MEISSPSNLGVLTGPSGTIRIYNIHIYVGFSDNMMLYCVISEHVDSHYVYHLYHCSWQACFTNNH